MFVDDTTRLRHILDAAREATAFTENKSRQDLAHDRMLALALVQCIEVIGEAAAHISPQGRNLYPTIPWSRIIRSRSQFIPDSSELNLDLVWNTITQDIPPLITTLEKMVPAKEPAGDDFIPQQNITVPSEEIAAFCRRNHIRKLSLFGSVLRNDFGPHSDIDVLVEFEPGHRVGLLQVSGMELELTELLGRKVDLRTPGDLSPYFRQRVLDAAEIQYANR